jgi:hypothetical protein
MKKSFPILIFCFFFFAISVFPQEVQKFNEFGNVPCEYLRSSLDIFFKELKDTEDAKGYIIVYEGKLLIPWYNKENKTIYPQRGEANAVIKFIKDHLKLRSYDKTSFRNSYDKNRVIIVNGGFRQEYSVEFWIVPYNAKSFKPAPTLKKMRYRKGRAKRYDCS